MSEKVWINLSKTDSAGQAAEKIVMQTDYLGTDSSGIVSISYHLKGFWNQDNPFGKKDLSLFDIPQAGFASEYGVPMVIREGLFVAIPQGSTYEKLEAKIIEKKELAENYDLLSVPKNVLETEETSFEPNIEIFSSDAEYPGIIAEYVDTVEIMGVQCVHLYVYPLQYKPKSKKINALTNILITVHFNRTDSVESTQQIRNPKYTQQLLGYPQKTDKLGTIGTKPRMLIITTTELAYSLRIYEGVKKITYDVSITMKEDILLLYPGKSEQEAIHSYIMAEDKKNHISYLVLGGGIDKIPTRMLRDPSVGEIANDNYYCSTGDKNKPLPLFALGRFPVSTIPEMNDVVDFASYYNRFFNNKRKTAIFTSFNDSSRGYEQCKEDIAATLAGDFTVTKCYDGKCSKKELIEKINAGTGIINYRGHGDYDCWQSSNGLSTADVPGLKVERNTPQVLSIACNNNGIHKTNCFGISWIKNLKAVSFLGASAPSYTYTNHHFDKFLWEAIHKEKITIIGDIFVWATLALYRNYPDNLTTTNILEYLLLGDPSSDYMDDKSDK